MTATLQPRTRGHHAKRAGRSGVLMQMRSDRYEAELLAEECTAVLLRTRLHMQYAVQVRHVRYPWWTPLSARTGGIRGWGVYLSHLAGGLQEMSCAILREVMYQEQHAR